MVALTNFLRDWATAFVLLPASLTFQDPFATGGLLCLALIADLFARQSIGQICNGAPLYSGFSNYLFWAAILILLCSWLLLTHQVIIRVEPTDIARSLVFWIEYTTVPFVVAFLARRLAYWKEPAKQQGAEVDPFVLNEYTWPSYLLGLLSKQLRRSGIILQFLFASLAMAGLHAGALHTFLYNPALSIISGVGFYFAGIILLLIAAAAVVKLPTILGNRNA